MSVCAWSFASFRSSYSFLSCGNEKHFTKTIWHWDCFLLYFGYCEGCRSTVRFSECWCSVWISKKRRKERKRTRKIESINTLEIAYENNNKVLVLFFYQNVYFTKKVLNFVYIFILQFLSFEHSHIDDHHPRVSTLPICRWTALQLCEYQLDVNVVIILNWTSSPFLELI